LPKRFVDLPKVIWSGGFNKFLSSHLDYVEIPLISGMAMAHSIVLTQNDIIGWTIIHNCELGNKRKLVAIKIRDGKDSEFTGMSMEPFIKIGDVICIDRNDREVKRASICAIRRENGSLIRKVERRGNELIISSEKGDIEDVDPNDPNPIIGKGIWIWRSLR
jgi:hypothetical protein